MKTRSLVTLAVASTFGWSAGAFAGSSHEVATPFSVSESGQNLVQQHHGFGSSSLSTATSDPITRETGHQLQLSDSSDWSASYDQMAEADIGEFYLVSLTPVTMESWDYYVIDADQLAMSEETFVFIPVDYIALIEDESLALSQEGQVDIILSEAPVVDTAEVG